MKSKETHSENMCTPNWSTPFHDCLQIIEDNEQHQVLLRCPDIEYYQCIQNCNSLFLLKTVLFPIFLLTYLFVCLYYVTYKCMFVYYEKYAGMVYCSVPPQGKHFTPVQNLINIVWQL